MKVTLIEPYGFCGGVTRALQTAFLAKKKHPTETIYLIGALVHNEKVTDSLQKGGFVFLDGDEKAIKKELWKLEKGSVICFSAHGHPSEYEEIAAAKGLIVYDATCPFVKLNEKRIKEAIENEQEVYYIGKKGHAEAISALSISPKVHLYEGVDAFKKNADGTSIVVFSQTTVSQSKIKEAIEEIKTIDPQASIQAKRCPDAQKRQEGIQKKREGIDLVVILGSRTSNNSKELLNLAKSAFPGIDAFLVLSATDIDKKALICHHHALLSSGASTDEADVRKSKAYLESL